MVTNFPHSLVLVVMNLRQQISKEILFFVTMVLFDMAHLQMRREMRIIKREAYLGYDREKKATLFALSVISVRYCTWNTSQIYNNLKRILVFLHLIFFLTYYFPILGQNNLLKLEFMQTQQDCRSGECPESFNAQYVYQLIPDWFIKGIMEYLEWKTDCWGDDSHPR